MSSWEKSTTIVTCPEHTQTTTRYANGLTLVENLLSPCAYQDILLHIHNAFNERDLMKEPANVAPHERKPKAKRVGIHYGPQFDYATNHVKENPVPMPPWMDALVAALPVPVNQATLQYYPPGAGIPPHIDTHSCFNTHIISYSAAAPVNMEFKRATAHTATKMFAPRRVAGGPTVIPQVGETEDVETVEVSLPGNSLAVMEGEIRYAWTHGIRSRTTDPGPDGAIRREGRFSITFRSVDFNGICECDYPTWCDSRKAKLSLSS
ncbi:hypothetical protein DICA3_A00166 [Diutina catenulata]